MIKMSISFFAAVLIFAFASTASAAPIYCEATVHYYESVSYTGNWSECRTTALEMTYDGYEGDLLTINSFDEYLFLNLNITGTWSGWAVGAIGATITDETAYWINGEGAVDTGLVAWYGSEPGALDTVVGIGDYNYSNGMVGFTSDADFDRMVVEYVPEPATMGLLALGTIALLAKRRK